MNNNMFVSHFSSTPPITRFISLAIVTVIALVYIKAVSPYSMMYSFLFMKKLEFWRIFTCFLYFGKPSLDVFIHISFLYRYSKMLEEGFIDTSDYFWLIVVISTILFVIANIFNLTILASAFASTITYIWTRRNPHALVQIFGFISFPAFYLPFIVPLFMLITEKRILVEDLLGIIVGHVYFFFKDVYPKWGSDVLKTPCFVKRLFREHPSDCCKYQGARRLSLNRNVSNVNIDLSTRETSDEEFSNDSSKNKKNVDLSIDDVNKTFELSNFLDDKTVVNSKSIVQSENSKDLGSLLENRESDEDFSGGSSSVEEVIEQKNKESGESTNSQNNDINIKETNIKEFIDKKGREENDWDDDWSDSSVNENI